MFVCENEICRGRGIKEEGERVGDRKCGPIRGMEGEKRGERERM